MGAGPHPTRPRRHLWEKNVYCKTERWEWRNTWISKLSGSNRVSARTHWSKHRGNGQADFVWLGCVSLCSAEDLISFLATTLRIYLFMMQIMYAGNTSPLCNWILSKTMGNTCVVEGLWPPLSGSSPSIDPQRCLPWDQPVVMQDLWERAGSPCSLGKAGKKGS